MKGEQFPCQVGEAPVKIPVINVLGFREVEEEQVIRVQEFPYRGIGIPLYRNRWGALNFFFY